MQHKYLIKAHASFPLPFFPDACCSPRARALLSTVKTYSPADCCTKRGGGAVPRSQHLKTLLPTVVRGSKGKKGCLPPPDISLPSLLDHYLSAVSIPHLPTGYILYQHFPSLVVAVSVQVRCSNFASSSKPEVNGSCLPQLLGHYRSLLQPHHPPSSRHRS